MTIDEYKSQLMTLLKSLPKKEREEAVAFYMELIADHMENGATEAEAVSLVATPVEAAGEIIANIRSNNDPIISFEVRSDNALGNEVDCVNDCYTNDSVTDEPTFEYESTEGFFAKLKQRNLSVLEWVAVIVTSPLWLSLLIGIFGILVGLLAAVFMLYLCVWILIACIWIMGVAFVVSTLGALVLMIWGIQTGNIPYMLMNIGYMMTFFGGGIWILKAAFKVSYAFLEWSKNNISVQILRRKKNDENSISELQVHTDAVQCETPNVAQTCSTQDFANPLKSSTSEKSGTSHFKLFFRVCWILVIVGFSFMFLGYVVSGFDWRVFLNINFGYDGMYLGGVKVSDPSKLLFYPKLV